MEEIQIMKTIEEKISVMQAFAEGKEIERIIKSIGGLCWVLDPTPSWNWYSFDYRVKEEPKQPEYIPFTFEDAEHLIGKSVKHKKDSWVEVITYCNKNETSSCMYEDLLRDYTFLDGSPCGKLKQTT